MLRHHIDPKWEFRAHWLNDIKTEKRKEISRQLSGNCATLMPKDVEDAAHGDQAIGVISAMVNNKRSIESVNVRNNGALSFLPDDAVVENSCIVGDLGALPVIAGQIPYALQAMIQSVHTSYKLSVDAALSGDRKLVMQAVMAHPTHRDAGLAEKIIDELFEAHKGLLPNFKD